MCPGTCATKFDSKVMAVRSEMFSCVLGFEEAKRFSKYIVPLGSNTPFPTVSTRFLRA